MNDQSLRRLIDDAQDGDPDARDALARRIVRGGRCSLEGFLCSVECPAWHILDEDPTEIPGVKTFDFPVCVAVFNQILEDNE